MEKRKFGSLKFFTLAFHKVSNKYVACPEPCQTSKGLTFKRQPHKMVKHTQTIRRN